MSPELEKIAEIERLIEQENTQKTNYREGISQDDVWLQKQLLEELQFLSIQEELEQIHHQRVERQKIFKRLSIAGIMAILILTGSLGWHFYNTEERLAIQPRQSTTSKTKVKTKTDNFPSSENASPKALNTSSNKALSNLFWLKDSLGIKREDIKHVHLFNEKGCIYNETRYNGWHRSREVTVAAHTGEMIILFNKKFYYARPIKRKELDSLLLISKNQNSHYETDNYFIEEIKIFNAEKDLFIRNIFLSADGNTFYFAYRSDIGKSYDLWQMQKIDGVWQNKQKIKELSSPKSYEYAPSMSVDGKTMYFVRRPSPVGCGRIYYSEKNTDDTWSKPKMIPIRGKEQINFECDTDPHIMPDGKTLLFTGYRSGNKGSNDLYYIRKQDNNRWSDIKAIGGVNSDSTEGRPMINPFLGKMYFSRVSNHCEQCLNHKHLCSVDIPEELKGALGDPPLQAASNNRLKDRATGSDFELDAFTFDSDKATLKPAATQQLERIVLFLTENPQVRLKIVAHTDDEGSLAYNQNLSERRAESVKTFLLSKGILAERLQTVGKGETVPKIIGTDDESRTKNRRVEFFVIETN